jgi:hypothetical protein
MFTNTNTVRGVTVHDVQQGEQLHDGAPGRRLSEPTHGIAHQPFIEPAGTNPTGTRLG